MNRWLRKKPPVNDNNAVKEEWERSQWITLDNDEKVSHVNGKSVQHSTEGSWRKYWEK